MLDRADVDTDQIIPKQFLKRIERTGFGEFLFYDWAKEDGWELPANPILATGPNFGCGSSREHAPWALQDYGFKAVVAESFADIFFSNCTKIGLLPVVLPGDEVRALMEAGEAEVDLEALEVRFGGRAVPFELDDEIRHRLLNGLDDIALTLQQADAIEAYEADRERDRPRSPPPLGCRHAEDRDPARRRDRTRGARRRPARAGRRSRRTSTTRSTCSAARASTPTARRSPTRCSRPAAAPTPSCSPPSAARSGTPPTRTPPRPEQGLLGLRKGLGLYANLRPVRAVPALYDASPLKREIIERTDLLVVRELTGGIYFGDKGRANGRAHDVCEYSVAEIERIARTAFRAARSRVTSVDKANVLETSRLWREVVTPRALARSSPTSSSSTCWSTTPRCSSSRRPRHFDVILTENMFGDILSDEAAMLTGSIGMLPSASLGEPDEPGRVRARPRLRARHRRARGSPTRWR